MQFFLFRCHVTCERWTRDIRNQNGGIIQRCYIKVVVYPHDPMLHTPLARVETIQSSPRSGRHCGSSVILTGRTDGAQRVVGLSQVEQAVPYHSIVIFLDHDVVVSFSLNFI